MYVRILIQLGSWVYGYRFKIYIYRDKTRVFQRTIMKSHSVLIPLSKIKTNDTLAASTSPL